MDKQLYQLGMMSLTHGESRWIGVRAYTPNGAMDRIHRWMPDTKWMCMEILTDAEFRDYQAFEAGEYAAMQAKYAEDCIPDYTEDDCYWERKEYEQLDHHAHVTAYRGHLLQYEDIPF